MPPTFLFLLYKIIKEQTIHKPSKTHPLNSATQSQSPEPKGPNSQSRLAPSLRCRVSRTLSKPCQPIFFKKFTALSTVPLSSHQPNFHPINAAQLTTLNISVNRSRRTTRTKLSAASSVAALVDRHIDPTNQNCQRLIRKNTNFSFHRQSKTILPILNQTNHPDSYTVTPSPSWFGILPYQVPASRRILEREIKRSVVGPLYQGP